MVSVLGYTVSISIACLVTLMSSACVEFNGRKGRGHGQGVHHLSCCALESRVGWVQDGARCFQLMALEEQSVLSCPWEQRVVLWPSVMNSKC